jgi:hypothetical protein
VFESIRKNGTVWSDGITENVIDVVSCLESLKKSGSRGIAGNQPVARNMNSVR